MESTAVRELLIDHIENRSSGDYSTGMNVHQTFFADLDGLNGGVGYPTGMRKVAWANGSWDSPNFNGDDFVLVNHQTTIINDLLDSELTSLDRQPGSFLPESFSGLVDGRVSSSSGDYPTAGRILLRNIGNIFNMFTYVVSLGTSSVGDFYTTEVVNTPTFIPTTSALDRGSQTSPTAFDETQNSAIRRSHDAVPDGAVTFLLEELGFPVNGLPPAAPSNFRITNYYANGQSPNLAWDPPAGGASASSYRVYRRCVTSNTSACVPSTSWQPIGTTTGTSYTDGGAVVASTGDRLYEYRATGLNMNGESPPSNAASVRGDHNGYPGGGYLTANPGGGRTPTEVELAPSAPNPTSGPAEIVFGLPEPGPVTLAVYDVTGREVARLADGEHGAGYHRVRLDATDLAPGTYVYRLTTPAGHLARTLAVVR